jgi:hypothetical protein
MASLVGSSSTLQATRSTDWRRFALVGLVTIAAAVLANVIVYGLGRATVGSDPQFTILADVGTTIFFTIIPAIVAVLLYALLLRFARRPDCTFAIIAAVVFVLTTIPDFTYIPSAPGATIGQTTTLVLMHTVAATVIVGLLTRFAQPAR